MYEGYFGLSGDPFRLSPTGINSLEHSSYKKNKSYFEYALERREGLVVIYGMPGTGKTTLINHLLREMKGSSVVATSLTCSSFDGDSLIRYFADTLGINDENGSQATVLRALITQLRTQFSSGKQPVLILDEAQSLSIDALEQVRLLTNYHVFEQQLLLVVLVGQPELLDKILSASLTQLHQRIISTCTIEPLNKDETRSYFMHRLENVGWKNRLSFDSEIFEILYQASEGIPRWVNLIGSRLLLYGMVEQVGEFKVQHIKAVVSGLVEESLLPQSVRTADINKPAGNHNSSIPDSD